MIIKTTALFLKEKIQKTIIKTLEIIKKGKPNDKKLKYGKLLGEIYALKIVPAKSERTTKWTINKTILTNFIFN